MGGMVALPVPTNLVESTMSDGSAGQRDWFTQLPGIVRELAERWSLRLGEPYQPGGQCAWVAPVRDDAGRELVLKVGWRHDEAAHEADGLRAWSGHGAVLLHESRTWASTSALLLERCRPGTTLATVLAEPKQDVVVAGLLRRLWITPLDGCTFRPLQAMCDAWALEFEAKLTAFPGALDSGLARAGIDLFRHLPSTAGQRVLLCTDLHAENVLAAEREPWLMIDPKPYVGDQAYDALQHMLNCEDRLATDPLGLARRMADLLGLEGERVAQWLFARCVQESIGDPSLRTVAAALAPA